MPLAGGDSAVRQPLAQRDRVSRRGVRSRCTCAAAVRGDSAEANGICAGDDFAADSGDRNVLLRTPSFDAVSSLLGIRHESSYEGQAAIELEAAAGHGNEIYPFQFLGGDPFQIDFRPTIQSIVQTCCKHLVSSISAKFSVGPWPAWSSTPARKFDSRLCLQRICLSGGTFQNLRLLEQSVGGLRNQGFEVFIHHRVPTNDGGISLGQAVIANKRLKAS